MWKVIGLVGPTSSGKGAVARILRERGYEYFSLSDMLREEARSRGLDPNDTKTLQDLGDELRQTFGAAVLAERTVVKGISRLEDRKIVIDSIRNPAEVRFLREVLRATIIGIDASVDTRWRRFQDRGRDGNIKTKEQFLAMDGREIQKTGDPFKIDVTGCLELADKVIINNGTIDDLMEGMQRFFKETKETKRRRKEG
jgi:dephospho-CoA kinase